jgi:hypothetical protein
MFVDLPKVPRILQLILCLLHLRRLGSLRLGLASPPIGDTL